MSRAKRPLNKSAVKKADAEFHAKHPELKGKSLSGSDPKQAGLRKEWMALYKKNNGKIEKPSTKPPKPPKGTKTKCPPTNGPFATADAAAKAALKKANPKSIKDNLEYSGLIYKKDGKYYYTGPAKGTDQGADPLGDAPAPAGTKVVGDYHTHGDYSTADAKGNAVRTKDPKKDQFNSDNFSGADKLDNTKQGYPGYLGTPSGTFRKYDPATGKDSVLK